MTASAEQWAAAKGEELIEEAWAIIRERMPTEYLDAVTNNPLIRDIVHSALTIGVAIGFVRGTSEGGQ